jgi:DNA/RNA-binding domain of Phe-tRNA-synthetase-like protein
MKIELTSRLRIAYPKVVFGSLMVRSVPNMRKHEVLEKRKRDLKKKRKELYMNVDEDNTILSYNTFFKRWCETYPIEFQIKTIKKGGTFPLVSVLVDSMFLAELKNRHLTSGHNLDAFQGDLTFDVSEGGERYLKLNGKEQQLRKDDVILKDKEGILASVLYGPARRTSITPETRNVLYLAWYPYGMDGELITAHLGDILSNLSIVFGSVTSEVQIHG